MSPATRDLLVALFDEDLPFRNNIHALDEGGVFSVRDEVVELADNGHMLGSVQVRVTTGEGRRIGYSSDFFWPAPSVLKVDCLVVDSTYGSPDAERRYRQHDVEERLVEIVAERARARPVVVCGYRGRLQHAMKLLLPVLRCPIVVSERVDRLVPVYQKYGFEIGDYVCIGRQNGIVDRSEPFVAFVELTEVRNLPWTRKCATVTLSAFMVPRSEPILDYGNGDLRVALTDHADYRGTLEFINATGAAEVLAYPCSGHPEALVEAIRAELGLSPAETQSNPQPPSPPQPPH